MTERVGEFVIDAGPDALLVQKPAAVALCNELGLGDRLFPTKLPRTAFVLRDGAAASASRRLDPRISDAPEAALHEHAVRAAGKAADGGRARSFRRRRDSRTTSRLRSSCDAGSGPRPSPTSPSRCSQAFTPATSSGFRCARCFRDLIEAEARAGSVIRAFRRERRPGERRRRIPIVSERPRGARSTD